MDPRKRTRSRQPPQSSGVEPGPRAPTVAHALEYNPRPRWSYHRAPAGYPAGLTKGAE